MIQFIIFSILISSTLAGSPLLVYGTHPGVVPHVGLLGAGAPLGPDGRVVDTPEVAAAKAQHEVAQINQRIKLANEAAKSADPVVDTTTNPAAVLAQGAVAVVPVPGGAPLGPDGTVVDTPEVTRAKADHAAAQINERIKLTQESIKSGEIPLGAIVVPPVNIWRPPVPIQQVIYPFY